MKRTLVIASLLLPACAGPAPLARVEVPAAVPAPRVVASEVPDTADEAKTQAWLRDEAARQRGGGEAETAMPTVLVQQPAPRAEVSTQRPPDTTNGDATRAWFDRTIEERRVANPDQPPAPIYQTVERTVYVDRPVYYRERDCGRYGYGYDDCGEPIYYSGYYGPRYRGSTFPLNTALGAGIGAIIGHQSHHRGRGAAIGAGIGLLFDLAR